MKFILRPDPDRIAEKSRDFITGKARISKDALDKLEASFNELNEQYGDGKFSALRRLNEAEEDLNAARALHKTNLAKMRWETNREWMKDKQLKLPEELKPKPWLDDRRNWLNIFRHRQNKPTTNNQ